jgi:hypothetical protein
MVRTRTEDSFYDDLEFANDDLDKAWQEQPSLYMRYAEKAAKARQTEDELKEQLEVLEAKLAKEMRTDPDKYGLSKVTEGALKEAVIAHEERQKLSAQIVEAKFDREILQYAVTAFEHRKKALENAVSLYLCGFYSQPKDPEETIRKHLNKGEE